MQWRLAAAFTAVMRDIDGNVPKVDRAWDAPEKVLWWPTRWRQTYQLFKARLGIIAKGFHASEVWFENARWDSQASEMRYGAKSIDQKVNERQSDKSKIIHNATDAELHVSYEEAVERTNAFSSTITKGCTLDMTKEAGVDTSVTVGAEYAGVKAEASVAAHFGVSQTKSESSELGKEESEEGTESESLAIEFDAKPRSYYLVEVTKENERTSQPFDINGVMDFDIVLTIWNHRDSPLFPGKNKLRFAGVDEFEQFVRGFDTNHPGMSGWWEKASQDARNAVAFILTPGNRRIQVSGISHASLDSNANYSVELLGDHAPDGLDDLPVEDAGDLAA